MLHKAAVSDYVHQQLQRKMAGQKQLSWQTTRQTQQKLPPKMPPRKVDLDAAADPAAVAEGVEVETASCSNPFPMREARGAHLFECSVSCEARPTRPNPFDIFGILNVAPLQCPAAFPLVTPGKAVSEIRLQTETAAIVNLSGRLRLDVDVGCRVPGTEESVKQQPTGNKMKTC